MDYELRIVVEKVAVRSPEVGKRDTSTSYTLQRPTSSAELGLRHAEQLALLAKMQTVLLAEHSLWIDHVTHVCPTCGNMLQKNGSKAAPFHAVFREHTVRSQKQHGSHPDCGWQSTPTITSLFGTNIPPALASLPCTQGALDR